MHSYRVTTADDIIAINASRMEIMPSGCLCFYKITGNAFGNIEHLVAAYAHSAWQTFELVE